MELDSEILAIFSREAEEYLQVLEDAQSSATARRRASHGLRGAAAMVGLPALAGVARELEETVALGATAAWSAAVQGLRRQLDALQQAAPPAGASPPAGAFLPQGRGLARLEASSAQEFEAEWDPQTAQLLRACFVEEAKDHLEAIAAAIGQLDGANIEQSLSQILRKVHTLKGSAATVGLGPVSAAAHGVEELLQAVLQGRRAANSLSAEKLLALVDGLRQLVNSSANAADQASASQLATDPEAQLAPFAPIPAHTTSPLLPGLAAPPAPAGSEQARLRVAVRQLDALMNLVGELVIDRTRIERRVEELKALAQDLALSRRTLQLTLADTERRSAAQALSRLQEVEGELSTITRDLEHASATLGEDAGSLRRTSGAMQELLAQVRLMPIHWLHARLQRPLKELAQSQGKRIALAIQDESSGLDRSLAEPVGDALTQLVRNAVAHGIELPAARAALGKPEVGAIRITARHRGDQLLIAVHDDGGGVDFETLRQVVQARGVLPPARARELSEPELLELIFTPGVSTWSEADQLAGRGMGLDIVRQNIAGLGGSVQVSTTAGQGTTFLIQLPLTTAIARALLFKVGPQTYALPVGHVEGIDLLEASELKEEGGRTAVQVRGSWVPLLRLEPLLQAESSGTSDPGPRPGSGRLQIIALAHDGQRFAISCSRVIGPREIVLKRIGPLLAAMPLLAGATVSGSSKVQFVLDVAYLASLVAPGAAAPQALTPPLAGLPARPRLLLADDSRAVREAVALMLRQASYEVDLACDGWEAWEALQQQDYQLLLTDLEMPRLHGLELIRRCQKDPRLNPLPIVVLSSRSSRKSQQTAIQLGASAFLAKPVNRALILAQLQALLSPDRP